MLLVSVDRESDVTAQVALQQGLIFVLAQTRFEIFWLER